MFPFATCQKKISLHLDRIWAKSVDLEEEETSPAERRLQKAERRLGHMTMEFGLRKLHPMADGLR